MRINSPYLLFLGDVKDNLSAKVATGIAHWRADICVGQLRLSSCTVDLGLPDLSPSRAAAKGAKTLVIGAANAGGHLPDTWAEAIIEALNAGMDVANGLHRRLASVTGVAAAAEENAGRLIEVRVPDGDLPIGTGNRRQGKRILTVGTDCSVGKMYTSLALQREMKARGLDADFRATGQTGIFIAGSGVPLDAVISDFISGAAEAITPEAGTDHWDVVEGQGSLFHPSFAGVTIGLIHGTQPDALVMCHEPTRPHMRGLPGRSLPSVRDCIEQSLEAARLTNPNVRMVGLAVNTSALEDNDAQLLLNTYQKELSLPAIDPVRSGVAPIVDCLLGS